MNVLESVLTVSIFLNFALAAIFLDDSIETKRSITQGKNIQYHNNIYVCKKVLELNL